MLIYNQYIVLIYWTLFNTKSDIFQLYHGENKLYISTRTRTHNILHSRWAP